MDHFLGLIVLGAMLGLTVTGYIISSRNPDRLEARQPSASGKLAKNPVGRANPRVL